MDYVDIERTWSEVNEGGQVGDEAAATGKPLSAYAEHPALVLLGPSGAGKTTECKREADRLDACYETTRDFLTLNDPNWRNKTLFIDGLDEMRAGSSDRRTPLDCLRTKLQALGRPPFRLSCREADWLGTTDQKHLAQVAQNGEVLPLRLDPLSDENVRTLLASRKDLDVESFLLTAEQMGLSGLLATPLQLNLLATAMVNGHWPTSRTEMFQMACRELAKEQNPEHVDAKCMHYDIDTLIEAAGRLCAIALLSGKAGYRVRPGAESDHHIPLEDISCAPSREVLDEVLSTRLFSYPSASRRFTEPAHRQIAEFLAAKHLAGLIDNNVLTPGRLRAVMSPAGGVVSSLRGLHAWLAVHHPVSRHECVERDAIGVVLYGDVRSFSLTEKRHLIERIRKLAQRDPWILRSRFELIARMSDLTDEETICREVLKHPSSTDGDQLLARSILQSFQLRTTKPVSRTLLLEIVRDHKRWRSIREDALKAFIKQHGSKPHTVKLLMALLQDIKAERVSDPDDELLGTLLSHLYPRHVPPSKIVDYMREPRMPSTLGAYHGFWLEGIVDRSTSSRQLGVVLNHVKAPDRDTDYWLRQHWPDRILERLLKGPMKVDSHRLCNWIAFAGANSGYCLDTFLEAWLKNNPRQLKALCAIKPKDCRVAALLKHLARRGRKPHGNGTGAGLPSPWRRPGERMAFIPGSAKPHHAEWQSYLSRNAARVRHHCPPGILGLLSDMYWGKYIDATGETPLERVRYVLQNKQLVDLAKDAIGSTPARSDLPSFNEIAKAADQEFPLVRAYLAALDIAAQTGKDMHDKQEELALACYFHTPLGEAHWYKKLVKKRPKYVASALVDYCRIAAKRRIVPAAPLASLAQEDHAVIARLASLGLLDLFPLRCNKHGLAALRHLLRAALEHTPSRQLAELIRRKLSRKSLTAMQRIHWLCCGLTLAPSTHIQPLLSNLAGRDERQRILCVVKLMQEGVLQVSRLDTETTKRLIERMGTSCPPTSIFDNLPPDGFVSPLMTDAEDAADAVQGLLDHLTTQPTRAATEALHSLASNHSLKRWESKLQRALRHQRATRLEAERPPAPREIAATLAGGPPANAADLAALTADCLREIGRRMRGDTSDWRKYWNTPHGQWTPKFENLCRDILLGDLRPKLPHGVSAGLEDPRVDDTKVDIGVACGSITMSVEIKRSHNEKVWKAMRSQLIKGYAKNPGSDGYGIYLVFWFGREHCTPHQGQRPATPAVFEQMLAQQLSPEETEKITVIVMDVAKPSHSR